ncbi:helix-turn-helix domain-containing protein [Nocardiopsis sp. NPDC049922]|uniref:helix-turn-helix domain-containing protein n=1 Tax=unclassified Nocardiopsis TaxID=2649073 RepID=UPI00096AB9C7|nr:helix-turn-helix domain-containing protein [Nocardiopsis sp. CNR-923]
MSPVELAEYLSVPKQSIYERWRIWGLKPIKVGKHLRFRERDIENWLEANRVSY